MREADDNHDNHDGSDPGPNNETKQETESPVSEPADSEGIPGRGRSLGASEAAAACGLNHYKRPVTLWLELTGRKEPTPGTDATEWGNLLEPVIRTKYANAHNVRIYKPEPLYRDGWMRASPDGVVVSWAEMEHWLHGLEVKTANHRVSHRWGEGGGTGEDIPLEYEVQCRWSMAVTGLLRWDVAALIGGSDYREYTVDRNAEQEERILSLAEDWWQKHIVRDQEPTPDGSKQYTRYLAEKFPRVSESFVHATTESDILVKKLHETRRHERATKKRRELLEQELKQLIGEFAGLAYHRDGVGEVITYKQRKGRTFTDWDGAMRELEQCHVERPVLEALVKRYAGRGWPTRALIVPRSWHAEGDDDDENT